MNDAASTPAAPATVPRGQEPKASPAVRAWAIILGLFLICLAAVLSREIWRIQVSPTTPSWIQPAIDVLARPGIETWMLISGAVCALIGLFFLGIAGRGRKRTHLALEGEVSTWIRHVDIARRSSAVARTIPGVTAARTVSARKGVHVVVNGDVNDTALTQRVHEAIATELRCLAHSPTVTVELEHIEEVDSNV